MPQLPEERGAGGLGLKEPSNKGLCRRPPYDGRFSFAPTPDPCGSECPIFPKKIGASGGWAEPHLLAFTAP